MTKQTYFVKEELRRFNVKTNFNLHLEIMQVRMHVSTYDRQVTTHRWVGPLDMF